MLRYVRIAFITGLAVLSLPACGSKPAGTGLKGSGSIEAVEVNVSPLIAGRLAQVLAREGAAVAKGELLAVLSADELSADLARSDSTVNAAVQNVRQAYETLRDAEQSLKRVRDNVRTGIASQQQLDSAETRYKVSEAQYRSAQAQETQARSGRAMLGSRFQETRLYSPLAGMVLSRNYEEGETVFAGNILFTLADLSSVTLKVYVPEDKLGKISLGQKTVVRVDSFPGRDFPGEVTHIASKAEFTPKNVQTEDSRTRLVFSVKITIPNPQGLLKPGMPADGYLLGEK